MHIIGATSMRGRWLRQRRWLVLKCSKAKFKVLYPCLNLSKRIHLSPNGSTLRPTRNLMHRSQTLSKSLRKGDSHHHKCNSSSNARAQGDLDVHQALKSNNFRINKEYHHKNRFKINHKIQYHHHASGGHQEVSHRPILRIIRFRSQWCRQFLRHGRSA